MFVICVGQRWTNSFIGWGKCTEHSKKAELVIQLKIKKKFSCLVQGWSQIQRSQTKTINQTCISQLCKWYLHCCYNKSIKYLIVAKRVTALFFLCVKILGYLIPNWHCFLATLVYTVLVPLGMKYDHCICLIIF